MAGATDKEHSKHAALTSTFIKDISKLMEAVDGIDDSNGFYLSGTIEVRHYDGWLAGYLKSYEDWWVFVPDGKDLDKA